MAFTHEEGWLGPYFACHRDFTTPDEFNLQMVHKFAKLR